MICHRSLRHLDRLTGWLMLLAGMGMLALTMLSPAWLSVRQLAMQQSELADKTRYLIGQLDAYQQFHLALVRGDPTVLERLAYDHLRLRPASTTMVGSVDPRAAVSGMHKAVHSPDPALARSVDRWLYRPVPAIRDARELATITTRLAAVARGPARLTLIASATVALAMGLLMPIGATPRHRRQAARPAPTMAAPPGAAIIPVP